MINKSCDIGQATIEFETGKLAIQAPGSIVVRSGETTVLVTAVSNNAIREGIDFFYYIREELKFQNTEMLSKQLQNDRSEVLKKFKLQN